MSHANLLNGALGEKVGDGILGSCPGGYISRSNKEGIFFFSEACDKSRDLKDQCTIFKPYRYNYQHNDYIYMQQIWSEA